MSSSIYESCKNNGVINASEHACELAFAELVVEPAYFFCSALRAVCISVSGLRLRTEVLVSVFSTALGGFLGCCTELNFLLLFALHIGAHPVLSLGVYRLAYCARSTVTLGSGERRLNPTGGYGEFVVKGYLLTTKCA